MSECEAGLPISSSGTSRSVTWQGSGPRAAQGAEGEERLDDAALHVEGSGAVETRAAFAPGHGAEGADGKDGVGVAEEQDARGAARGGEIDLQSGAEAGKFVQAGTRVD